MCVCVSLSQVTSTVFGRGFYFIALCRIPDGLLIINMNLMQLLQRLLLGWGHHGKPVTTGGDEPPP